MHSFRVYWMSLYMFQTVSFPHQLKSQNPDTVRTVNVSSVTTLNLRQLMSYVYMEHPFLMYLDHTQRRTTVGRTPLDEWSARRRDLYLTTHDNHNRQISMLQAANLLRSWIRIPPGAWIFVCCECRVLSGGGLCDEPITRPEESYRLWCVVVCDLDTSRMGAPYIWH